MSAPKTYEEWEMIAWQPRRKNKPKAEPKRRFCSKCGARLLKPSNEEYKKKKEEEETNEASESKDEEAYNDMIATSRMTDEELEEALLAFADKRDAEKAGNGKD